MWTKVNVGYNVEDETANFGTRACAVNNEAVYETNTLAEIHAQHAPTQLPRVCGKFFEHVGLCIAIDNSLTIFSKAFSSVQCVISFSLAIDVFTVSPCGFFVLVGQRCQLECFHILSQNQVFQINIFPHSDTVCLNSVTCYEEEGETTIICVLNNGSVMRSDPIDLMKINDFTSNKESIFEDIEHDVSFNNIFNMERQDILVDITQILLRVNKSHIFGTSKRLCSFNMEDESHEYIDMVEDYQIKRIGGVLNSSILVALDNNGSVMLVCLHTMTNLCVLENYHVVDLLVLDHGLLLLVEDHIQGLTLIQLSWPDCKIKYKIPVADTTFLIHQEDTEDTLFLEGVGTNEIETIRVKAVAECQPDLRLDRILRRYKFKEAEKFAKTFNLDLDIVYKAHVQKLCHDLDPWNPPKDNASGIFNTIVKLIQEIKDHHFVAEICTTATPPDFTMLHTMLMYGLERFSKVTDRKNPVLNELLSKVSKISRRLDTCMMIYGSATTVNHWIQFPKHDLMLSCVAHLKRGEIKEAILIWSRHLSDVKQLLDTKKVGRLLHSVSKSVSVEDLVFWLRQFVPPVLGLFPDTLTDIIDWTIQRARDLEIMDSNTWPASGLSLARCLLHLVWTPQTESSVLLQSHKLKLWRDMWSKLARLTKFIDDLQNVKTLKNVYGVDISYSQFIQDDHDSFVVALLESLPLDKIDQFMADMYLRLMRERDLDPEKQILQFVQDILMDCENYWFWDEAPWEVRVLALIPHINNIEMKLDTILLVLKCAPVPWTPAVSQLASTVLQLTHAKSNDIRNECKEIPKRLIMKKYGALVSSGKNIMKLVKLMLKKNLSTMLEDIEELTKSVDIDCSHVYIDVILHLLRNGNNSLVQEVLKTAVDKCPHFVYHMLSQVHFCMRMNDWDIVAALFECMPPRNLDDHKAFFSELKNVYLLKSEFSVSTTANKLCCLDEKESILDSYTEETAKQLVVERNSHFLAVTKVTRLANLLQFTDEEGVLSLARHCGQHNLLVALSVARYVEDAEMKPDRVYKKLRDVISVLIAFYNPLECDLALMEEFASVVHRLTRSFRAYCSVENLSDAVIGSVRLFHLTSKSILGYYRDPTYNVATAVIVHNLAKSIIFSQVRNATGLYPEELQSQAAAAAPESTQNEFRALIPMWKRLKEEQQDLSCIRLIFDYCWEQKMISPHFKEDITVNSFLSLCVKDLLRKLFRLRNFDIKFALSLIHFFTIEESIQFLVEEEKSARFNYQRLTSISHLALAYCIMKNVQADTNRFSNVCCKWAKKLSDLGLPHKDAFKNTDSDRHQLLLRLIALPSTTISMLEEFCVDMGVDQQECLMMHLEHLLLTWEPQYEITLDAIGEKGMVVKNKSNDLLRQCKIILRRLGSSGDKSMTWSEPIKNHLVNLWSKVNCYYYEVYFVLTKLYQLVIPQQMNIKHIKNYQDVLQFLQTYKRISSTNETSEQEQWFQLFPNKNHLPQISYFRLPFTPFFIKETHWDYIKPELSLKTYKIWLTIVLQLGIDPNMLCMLTIQRLSSDQLGGSSHVKCGWYLQTCNNTVLKEIEECVNKITNQEMASAALYYVVNHMPPGADQMAAATLCYRQAELWHAQDHSENARLGFAKVQKKYLTVCTNHILHSSGLGRQEYLQLVLHPMELIVALYDDPSILQRESGPNSHCPDINNAVSAIGKLHNINVLGIQQDLLSEWLSPPDQPPLDMSCDDITQTVMPMSANTATPADNHSILRACYVLESMEMETAASYLVSCPGILNDMELRPTTVRLRALQCLCSVATSEIVVQVTGKDLKKIEEKMQHLMFMSELEKLGLVWSIEGFENCNKEDVIRIVLLKPTPQAVQLAAAMGCAFSLTNVDYWNQILQLSTTFKLVDELSVLLPGLSSLSHMLDHSVFTRAWNCALLTPFQKAELPLTEETCLRLQAFLEMLYCCPVPRELDLAQLERHCGRLSHSDWIVRLQPFLDLTYPQIKYIKEERNH